MDTETNKAIARWALELLVAGDVAPLADHPGYWQASQYFPKFFAPLAGLRIEILHQVAEGNSVATRGALRGTHAAPWLGVAPTGQELAFDVFSIDQLDAGRITQHNATADLIGVLIQLGVIDPRPPEP